MSQGMKEEKKFAVEFLESSPRDRDTNLRGVNLKKILQGENIREAANAASAMAILCHTSRTQRFRCGTKILFGFLYHYDDVRDELPRNADLTIEQREEINDEIVLELSKAVYLHFAGECDYFP